MSNILENFFNEIVKELRDSEALPNCEWEPWNFGKPKSPKFGDLCTYSILRVLAKQTVINYNKQQDSHENPDFWGKIIIEKAKNKGLPENIDEIYCEKGILNIRFLKQEEQKVGNFQEFKPIGYLESCFSEKFGTPRQSKNYSGLYSPLARGKLTLLPHINEDSLLGLEEFSHLWLIFLFHQSKHSEFKSKVKPPKLLGEKRGIFATRSPHRINPIGISLVNLEKIDSKTLHVLGIDLIDQTPILDIKPYHPADSVQEYTIPNYLTNPIQEFLVEFNPLAFSQLHKILEERKLKFYGKDENLEEIIKNILSQDPSTVHTKLKHPNRGLYGFAFDRLGIVYIRDSENFSMEIVLIKFFDEFLYRLRTSEWLEESLEYLQREGVIV